MKHIVSKNTGTLAEDSLFDMLLNERNKRRYVSAKLSKFSKLMYEIISLSNGDKKMTKYLLHMHKETHIATVKTSNLDSKEQSFLKNAIKARYMKQVNVLEIEPTE